MAFLWRRILKQSQIDTKLLNQFTRSYLQIHRPISANNRTKISAICNPSAAGQFELPSNVRFFAARVNFVQKKEEKGTRAPRLNEQIIADVVRLVTDEGHSIVSRHEALNRARSLNLDLVEVQRNAEPPVCKLMEYRREKYKQELKGKDRAKKKSEISLRKGGCKEVRFSAKITQNDLQIKADTVKRLMETGYRVKCLAIGDSKDEDSATLLSRFFPLIEDISVVESDTRVEEKDQVHVILRHVKYGPLKKGLGKKASRDKKAASAGFQEVESDDDAVSEEKDEDVEQNEKSGWTIDDANDDFDKLFDLKCNADEVSNGPRNEKLAIARETLSSPGGGSSHYSRPGGRNTLQSGSQFSDMVRRPPSNMNASPQRRETQGVNSEFSASKNSNIPEQGFAPNIPDSPVPSYGIFSAQQGNDAYGKRNIPGEVNRYKQRNASNSVRNSNPPSPMGHQNGPMSNSRVGREQAVNRDGQGRWGVFSGESTSMMPDRTFEGQAKVQR